MFPLVPLLPFLSGFAKLHEESAVAFTVGLGFFGLFILMLWVPSRDLGQLPKERIRLGFGLLGASVISLISGFYFFALVVTALVVYIVYCLVAGAKTAFGKSSNKASGEL